MMTELLPCSHCGGEAELLTFWDFYKFSCKNADCTAHVADAPYVQHAEGVWYGSIDEARAAWNTRAGCKNCAALNRAAGLWAKADKRARELERTCRIVKTWSDSDYVDGWRYRCSECDCFIPVDERDQETGDVISAANYCPNCGARVKN